MSPGILKVSSSEGSPIDVSIPSMSSSSLPSEVEYSPECGPKPIAIVGMGCRLPGSISSPTDLWKLIMAKGNAKTSKVPSSRFNIDAHYHQNNERPGSFNVPGGYFLDGTLQEFDPTLFDISPVEAAWMDPQQRKLLEVVYEAFESSGCTLEQVSTAVTGCFVGSFTSDFQQMALKEPDFRHSYATTGIDPSIIGNRISHVFNLHGPSVLINTACSSSMYALHSACNSIRNGECEGAIVGGVNLMLTVDQQMNTAKLGVLSPTATCHTFDESADGYGRGEGAGALYIKSLDAALENGDPIRAIIRSTATNCNGRVQDSGITHPSLNGQVDVISTAYNLGNLDPNLTSYVECHGTGTAIGDPIEAHAISIAMRSGPNATEPIMIGSVKPNIGHSEAASSIFTIIKAVMAIENNTIPPTKGIVVPNKKIDWDGWHLKVVTEPTSFSSSLPVRRVGVNAFGYGGTNGHAILENVDFVASTYRRHKAVNPLVEDSKSDPDEDEDRAHLLVFSAHDKATLKRNINAYSGIGHKPSLLDLAYTLSTRRSKHSCRAYAVCRKESYSVDLEKASDSVVEKSGPATVAFAFTGQGAQWPRMGTKLFLLYPSFLRTIRELDSYLAKLPDGPSWSIEASLLEANAASQVNKAEFSQPLCTAVQVALVDLLNRWGIVPVATVGHSSGEIGAAYAAGYISAEDAIKAAYYRGKVVSSVNTNGAMLAVGLGAAEVNRYIEKSAGRVVIACHNSPKSVTLSGDASNIEELKSTFEEAKIFARVVKTGGKAYHHSHHMKEAARMYEDCLNAAAHKEAPSSYLASTCQMVSSVTGLPITEKTTNLAYWTANLLSPVLFDQAVQKMVEVKPQVNIVVEIGPHSALSGPIRQICTENKLDKLLYVPSLVRNEHDGDQLLKLAGSLWSRDAAIDVGSVTRTESLSQDGSITEKQGSFLVDLPTYQWNYTKKLWLESRQSKEHRSTNHARHDVLGRRVLGLSDAEPVWRNVLRHKDVPWLKHHFLGGESVFPAAGYFAMAIEAVSEMNSDCQVPLNISGYTLRDIVISTALVIPDDDEGVETLLNLRPSESGPVAMENGISKRWYSFTISSNSFGTWKEHTKGSIGINMRSRGRDPVSPPNLPLSCAYSSWSQRLRDLGFDFGSTFQCIENIQSDGKTHAATSDVIIKQESGIMDGESRYALHPSCIDSCLQLSTASIHAGRLSDVTCGLVLTHFDEVSIWPPTQSQLGKLQGNLHAWTPKRGNRAFLTNIQLVADDGELLADFSNMRSVFYDAAIPQHLQNGLRQDPYMQLEWKADPAYLKCSEDAGFPSHLSVERMVDLLAYKNAALQTLCLDANVAAAILEAYPLFNVTIAAKSEAAIQELQTNYSDYERVNFIQLDIANTPIKDVSKKNTYNLIVSSKISEPSPQCLENLHSLLVPGGNLVLTDISKLNDLWLDVLQQTGFSGVDCEFSDSQASLSNILSTAIAEDLPFSASKPESSSHSRSIFMIYREKPALFLALLSERFIQNGWNVRSGPLSSANHQPGEHIIMLADLEGPLLATLQDEELKSIQRLMETAFSMIWITRGGLLSGQTPDYAMTSGFARVLRSEKQSLDMVTLDLNSTTSPGEQTIGILMDIATRQAIQGKNGETEYCVDHGVVHIGRLIPSKAVNEIFAADQSEPKLVSLEDGTALKGVLQSGKVLFKNDERPATTLESSHVEIKVIAIGLNREDHLSITGSDDLTIFSHEVAGVVTRVSSDVSHLKIGDRVIGFAFNSLATYQRTPAKLLQPIAENDSFQTMVSLPTAFATALYGLHELARIEAGEIVLILEGSGPVGLAAIQLCNTAKAKAIVVTNSEDTIALLRSSNFSPNQIITPGKKDVLDQIQRATAGRGADVVLCRGSASPAVLAECCKNMAPFGRLVTFGRKDMSTPNLPNLSRTASSCGVFSFDLRDLYEERPGILARLLEKCMQLYNDRKISAIQPTISNRVSEINEAVGSFLNTLGSGKAVILYEPGSLCKVLPTKSPLQFRSDATYLLVGCLGGLGRSLTSWMIERGAKHLAFMSRSGIDKASAANLVDSIQALGVETTILRADVTSRAQVEAAIKGINTRFPIRGVVNAAMVLQDCFFQNMTINDWQKVVSTKVKGSLNLHQVFSQDHELDFFVMTSSIAATVGSAGQSNYAASNAFLDALALHRRSQGLPAISVILPMILGIGYVAEHPEIEALIRRKGMYGIDESELLAALEVAMTPQSSLPAGTDHLIVGMEPSRLAKSIKSTNADTFWFDEPRFGAVATAVSQHMSVESAAAGDSIIAAIERAKTTEEAIEAVTAHLVQRLSRLMMIDAEDFQPETRSIVSYGLDSMIGAEFRNWIFREFKIEVPFQQLLADNLTVAKLAVDLCEKIGKDVL